MAKVIAPVYETYDYDSFRLLPCNRDVTGERKNKLIASFSCKRIMTPIVINEKREIIDGQGRYEACKALKLPIWYVMQKGADLEDCRRLNRYNTKWQQIDFVKSFAESGNSNYIQLLKTCKELNKTISWVINASYKSAHNETGDFITEGRLIYTEEDALKAKEVCEKGNEIINALLFQQKTNNAFWSAVKVIIKSNGYDHSKMLRNCAHNRSSYVQMSNLESQLKEFERIYNFKSKQNKIYFSDYMRTRGYNVRTYDSNSSENSVFNRYDAENVSTLKRN